MGTWKILSQAAQKREQEIINCKGLIDTIEERIKYLEERLIRTENLCLDPTTERLKKRQITDKIEELKYVICIIRTESWIEIGE